MANLQTPDEVLVQKYISGDEKAFETLLKRHQKKVYSYIFSKVNDRDICEDVFQDTFVKVIKSLKSGNYNSNGRFFSWVLCIANNTAMDHHREMSRKPTTQHIDNYIPNDFENSKILSLNEVLVNDKISMELFLLVEELPESQKNVLKMRINDGLSFREIGIKTDTNINSVLGNMRYAINNLKKLIKTHKININEYNIL